MRGVLAALLLGMGLWRAWIDWQATIGAGYAYRLASIRTVLGEVRPGWLAAAPGDAGAFGTAASVVLALPLAPALILLGALVWRLGRRGRR